LVYAGLGDRNASIRWLEIGHQNHSASLLFIRVEPMLDRLRGDPRFEELVRKIGL